MWTDFYLIAKPKIAHSPIYDLGLKASVISFPCHFVLVLRSFLFCSRFCNYQVESFSKKKHEKDTTHERWYPFTSSNKLSSCLTLMEMATGNFGEF